MSDVAVAVPVSAEPRSPLQVRDFRVYWTGQLISLVGMWMQQMAQALVVTGLTGRSSEFGLLTFVSAVPMMLLSTPAGVLADRVDRRKILIATQILLGVLAGVLALLYGTGHLTMPWIYSLTAVSGCIAAFDFPAQQALVPQLVPPRLIGPAIGLNQAIFHGSRAVGPALAALLIALSSPTAAFIANGVSYLAVIYSLMIIPARPVAAKPSSGGKMLKEGLSYVWHTPGVRALVGLTGVGSMFMLPVFAVFMANFAKNVLHANDTQFGLIMTASGLGAFAGSIVMMKVPPALRGRFMLVGSAIAGSAAVLLSLATSPWAAVAIVLFLNSSSSLVFGLCATAIQTRVPDRIRGRVMGIYTLTFTGLMPPAALLWGFIADHAGLPLVIRCLGITYAVLGISLVVAARMGREPAPQPAG